MKKLILSASFLFLCGYWFILKIGVPFVISNQVDSIREQGYDIQYKETYVGKSPLRLAWKISDLSIQTKDNVDTSGRFQLPDILVALSPLKPLTVTISSNGAFDYQQRVGETSTQYLGTVKQLRAEVNMTSTGALDGVDAALELTNIHVPETLEFPLGNTIEQLALDTEVDGELTIGGLQEAMQNWFEDEGQIEIKSMALSYGPVQMQAEGKIRLDEHLQPDLSMKTKTTGLYQAADLAVEQGYYSSRNRVEAHNVLDVMALNGNEQSGPVLEMELKVHDQRVLAGEMQLTKMDEIEW